MPQPHQPPISAAPVLLMKIFMDLYFALLNRNVVMSSCNVRGREAKATAEHGKAVQKEQSRTEEKRTDHSRVMIYENRATTGNQREV